MSTPVLLNDDIGLNGHLYKTSSPDFLILRFTAAYDQQIRLQKEEGLLLDVSDIEGTNCYCDEQAESRLKERLHRVGSIRLHYLDSGNYHYMTSFWCRKIKKPFRLIVFDHHTDMQDPAFGDILSCGGWISFCLRRLPALKEVILIGPAEEDLQGIDPQLRPRLKYIPEKCLSKPAEDTEPFINEILSDHLPVYISVDKDILSQEDASTSWTQGHVSRTDLLSFLESLFRLMHAMDVSACGMDVCGEADPPGIAESGKNELINMDLLCIFRRYRNIFL